jgi:Ca2+-binding RTX toxin-like protein
MARNFTTVGQEVQVNATALDGAQFDANVTALTDGRFAVVNTRVVGAVDWDVNLQFVTANGILSGERLLIDNDLGFQVSAAVAPRLGGGAVVVWTDQNGNDGSGNALSDAIQLRVVSATGTMSSPLTVIDGLSPKGNPDAAMLTNGQVVVVWKETHPGDTDIGLRVLNAAGTGFTGDPLYIDASASLDSNLPAIAASGNKALIAYEDQAGDNILVKLFDGATGTLSSLSFVAGKVVASTGDLQNPDVAALANGRYIVVWKNDTNDDIEGRFVDANGNPIGAAFTIGNNAGNNVVPRVAALPDGGFIVTWSNDGGVVAPENGGDSAVLARRFDSSGAAAGDLFLVNTGDPSTDQDFPAVAVNRSTGRAFIAWDDFHAFSGTGQDNDPPGIRGRAFLTTTDIVNGTSGNDTITTYSLSETINGLGGNDTINARGGNDSVNGGPGSDRMFGNVGNDTMVGGDGADTVDGEAGNDLVNGGLGNDVVTGGPGPDRFAFNTAIKPKGSNIDTIADFSAADDTILLDNAIFTKLKAEGVLKAKFFEVGKKAKSGKDFIVYNDKNGDVLYDKNGKKKGGAIAFAKLEGSPDDVSAADFLVI